MKHLKNFSTFENTRHSDKLTALDDIIGVFNDKIDVQVETDEDGDSWPIDYDEIGKFKLNDDFGDEIFTTRITGTNHFDGFRKFYSW